MKLSVIIVNYNVKYYLEQCLNSVLASIRQIETEIFVVDNHSSDGSLEYLQDKFPTVIFIANNDNPGFSKANNQAIERAKGEYVLLLNPDTVIGEHTLEQVCTFMDQHSDAGGLGVKMIDGYGKFLPESKRGFPSPWNSFCKMTGLSKLFPGVQLFSKYHLSYLSADEIHKVDVLAGAFMLLREKVLEKTGLLDEAFFMYGEDIDLSYRIILSGYNNYYLPEAIIHYKGESTKKNIRYVKTFYEAMLIFFKKHYPHYRKFFSYSIHFAIYIIGGLSVIDKVLFGRKKKVRRIPGNVLFVGSRQINEEIREVYSTDISIRKYKTTESRDVLSIGKILEDKFDDVVFSLRHFEYEEIIGLMKQCRNRKTKFWFYDPETKVMVSANEVIIKK